MLWGKVRTQVWQSSVKLMQLGFVRANSASGESGTGASTFAASSAPAVPDKAPTTAIVRSQRDICALPMTAGATIEVDRGTAVTFGTSRKTIASSSLLPLYIVQLYRGAVSRLGAR